MDTTFKQYSQEHGMDSSRLRKSLLRARFSKVDLMGIDSRGLPKGTISTLNSLWARIDAAGQVRANQELIAHVAKMSPKEANEFKTAGVLALWGKGAHETVKKTTKNVVINAFAWVGFLTVIAAGLIWVARGFTILHLVGF